MMRFLHEHLPRMSPKQERRATLPQAKLEGRPRSGCADAPRKGRIRSIDILEILKVGDE